MKSPLQNQIEAALQRLNTLVGDEGGQLTLIEVKGDSATIRFVKGKNADCESCAIEADTMEMLAREAITNQVPIIKKIHLIEG